MAKKNKKSVILIFILITCIFYLDKIILGPFASIRIHDTFDSEFSKFRIMGELLIKHGLFLWLPNIAGGMPSYAGHHPPYYILCLLSIFFPAWFLYSAMIIILMVGAGYGMYRLLYEHLSASHELSLMGGILFSLSTQIQPNAIVHTVFNYLFPLFYVWSTDLTKKTNQFRNNLSVLIGINLIFYVSYPVLTFPFFYVLHIILVLILFEGTNKRRLLLLSNILWVGYLLINIPELYQLYDYIPFSQRVYLYAPMERIQQIPIINFLQLLKSKFINICTLSMTFILFFGTVAVIRYSTFLRRCLMIIVAGLVISTFFGSYFSAFLGKTILAKMDLDHFSWTLPFLFMIFCFSGLQQLERNQKLVRAYFCGCLLGLLLLIIHLYPLGQIGIKIFLLNILAFIIFVLFLIKHAQIKFAKKILELLQKNLHKTYKYSMLLNKLRLPQQNSHMFCSTIIIMVLISLCTITRMIHFEDAPEKIPYKKYFDNYPIFRKLLLEEKNRPFRVGSISDLPPSAIMKYEWECADGRSPLFSGLYKRLFKASIAPQLERKEDKNHFDTYWYDLYFLNENKSLKLNLPVILMMNVRYLVASKLEPNLEQLSSRIIYAKPEKSSYGGLYNYSFRQNFQPYYLYELKNSFERGFLVNNAVILRSDEEVGQQLEIQNIDDLRRTAFYSKTDKNVPYSFIGKNTSESIIKSKIKLVYYSPDKVIFDIMTSGPAIFVLTNNYYPKWTASINGKNTTIYRTNLAFQSVLLSEAGTYSVVFEYKDKFLLALHVFVILGILLINYPVWKWIVSKNYSY